MIRTIRCSAISPGRQSVGNIGVPPEVRRALAGWQWSRKKLAGTHDPANLDPHSLPRTLVVAMFLRADAQAAIDAAVEASRTTQQSPVVLDLCRVWAALFVDAFAGVNKQTLLRFDGPAMQLVRAASAESRRSKRCSTGRGNEPVRRRQRRARCHLRGVGCLRGGQDVA